MLLAMLTAAGRPADDDHAYGHGKAEYFYQANLTPIAFSIQPPSEAFPISPGSRRARRPASVTRRSSGVEGALILIAAVTIGAVAVDGLIHPKPLEKIGLGLAVSTLTG